MLIIYLKVKIMNINMKLNNINKKLFIKVELKIKNYINLDYETFILIKIILLLQTVLFLKTSLIFV